MKYELPEDLKTHHFSCDKKRCYTSYRICKRNCPDTFRQCWETSLRKDLKLDCQIENEQAAEAYAVCPKCGSEDVLGTGFNGYMCCACGEHFGLSPDEQKAAMGDNYQEIDYDELDAELANIK